MTAEAWVSFFTWVSILGGVAVVVGGMGVWYYSAEVQRQRETRTATLEAQLAKTSRKLTATSNELTKKTAELAQATEQTRTLATRDVFRPPSVDVKSRVVQALQNLVRDGRAPTLTVLHLYNMTAINMNDFYRELKRVFDESKLPHEIGNMISTYSGMPQPPPFVLEFASDAEDRARSLIAAVKPFLTSDPQMRTKPKLESGTVEISIYGRPDFQADGSVVLR